MDNELRVNEHNNGTARSSELDIKIRVYYQNINGLLVKERYGVIQNYFVGPQYMRPRNNLIY